MNCAYIGLGANIGDPIKQLQQALDALSLAPKTRVTKTAAVYRSAPMGPQDQPDFYNTCAALETQLSAHELLSELQNIERTMGRIKRRHWGERCIDLDLLLYDQLNHHCPILTLPHPGIGERDFVLAPLIELTGGDYVVVGKDSVGDMFKRLTNVSVTKLPATLSAASSSRACAHAH